MKKSLRLAAAAVRRVGNVVTGANLHTRLSVGSSLRALALLDLSGHSQECLLDVGGVLGRGLEERNSQAVSELLEYALVKAREEMWRALGAKSKLGMVLRVPYLSNRVLDHLLVRHIALVAHE